MNRSEAEIMGGTGFGTGAYPSSFHHHMDLDLWSRNQSGHIYEDPLRPESKVASMEGLRVEDKKYPLNALEAESLQPQGRAGYYPTIYPDRDNVADVYSTYPFLYDPRWNIGARQVSPIAGTPLTPAFDQAKNEPNPAKLNSPIYDNAIAVKDYFKRNVEGFVPRVNIGCSVDIVLIIFIFVVVIAFMYLQHTQIRSLSKIIADLGARSSHA